MVANGGPVLASTIVALYQEAVAFCKKQHKEVATIKFVQSDQPHLSGCKPACSLRPRRRPERGQRRSNGSRQVSGFAAQITSWRTSRPLSHPSAQSLPNQACAAWIE